MIESKEKRNYLKSTILEDDIFNKITLNNLSDIEYVYLSSNPSLTPMQIERLFKKNIDNVNINLLRHKNCPKDKLHEFLKFHDKIYNIAIAHNESLDSELYEKLLSLDDTDINISLEYNDAIKKGL